MDKEAQNTVIQSPVLQSEMSEMKLTAFNC